MDQIKHADLIKHPAGVGTQLTTALGVEYRVTNDDQDLLNPLGVNCIRQFAGAGIIVDGAKTLSVSVGDNQFDTGSCTAYVPCHREGITSRRT